MKQIETNKTIFKKLNKLLLLFIATTFFIIGCDSTTEPPPVEVINNAVFVINEGGFGNNNSSASRYSIEDKTVQNDIYYSANTSNLGDTGNDLVIAGDNGFIAITGSNKIEVVSMDDFKSIGSINFEDYGGPRKIAISGSNGYATTANSMLVKFDISSLSVLDTMSIGFKPEGIVSSNGKLFIAISGWGAGNTITVVDESSFTVVENITVKINPTNIVNQDNDVFVVSTGSYTDGIGMITKIDASTMSIIDTLLITKNPGRVALGNDEELYVINGDGIVHVSGTTMSIIKETLVAAGDVNNIYFTIYSVGYDADADLLYLGNPKDFQQNGDVAIFNSSGVEEGRFDVGINPSTIVFKN